MYKHGSVKRWVKREGKTIVVEMANPWFAKQVAIRRKRDKVARKARQVNYTKQRNS